MLIDEAEGQILSLHRGSLGLQKQSDSGLTLMTSEIHYLCSVRMFETKNSIMGHMCRISSLKTQRVTTGGQLFNPLRWLKSILPHCGATDDDGWQNRNKASRGRWGWEGGGVHPVEKLGVFGRREASKSSLFILLTPSKQCYRRCQCGLFTILPTWIAPFVAVKFHWQASN